MLTSTIIEEVLRTSIINNVVVFFYCDYKDLATQKTSLVLSSLIQQIAKQNEQSLEMIERFCEIRNSKFTNNFNYDSQKLRDFLFDITLNFDCVTIIMNDLNECEINTIEMIELFRSLNNEAKKNIKTLFLSRNEVEIRDCLENYT